MIQQLNIPEATKEKVIGIGFSKRSKRNIFGIKTTVNSVGMCLISNYVDEYFTLSGYDAPTWLVELMNISDEVILDIDSFNAGLLRFYVGGRNTGLTPFETDYPFNYETPNLDTFSYLGCGFLFDMNTESMTQYKHYYRRKTDYCNSLNYHFNPDGTFNYLGEEERYDGASDFVVERKKVKNGEYSIQYVRRKDTDQKHLLADRRWHSYRMYMPAIG